MDVGSLAGLDAGHRLGPGSRLGSVVGQNPFLAYEEEELEVGLLAGVLEGGMGDPLPGPHPLSDEDLGLAPVKRKCMADPLEALALKEEVIKGDL